MVSANKHNLLKKKQEHGLDPPQPEPPLNPSRDRELENPSPIAMDFKNGSLSIEGSEEDKILKNSDALTLEELARRRSRRSKQLSKYYLKQYWALMEEVRFKYRVYYWDYGKGAFKEGEEEQQQQQQQQPGLLDSDEGLKVPAKNAENGCGFLGNGLNGEDRCGFSGQSKEDRCEPSGQAGEGCEDPRCGFGAETSEDRSGFPAKNGENRLGVPGKSFPATNGDVRGGFSVKNSENRCAFPGCKLKPMALTSYCHPHILSDTRQQLYKGCAYVIKSAQTGPIVCGKPIDRASVPSFCGTHLQKAQKRALKVAGLNISSSSIPIKKNISSSSKPAPKFHVVIAEYVHHIQAKRREAQREGRAEDADKGLSVPIMVKEENVD